VTAERLIGARDAEAAIDMALPSIAAALCRSEVSGEGVLHLVVMDPAARPGDSLERAVLCERSIGDPAAWGADYRRFARAKAELAWRHGRDTQELQLLEPHRLTSGDTLLWGSAMHRGIVVAASGAHPWYDAAFSHLVAAFLAAIAQDKAAAQRREAQFLA
jgi:hypothetical protein